MNTDRAPQIVVRITSQRGGPDRNLLASHMPGNSLEHGDIRFTVDDEPADVVVVLNYLKYDTVLRARKGYIWNWHNEPINRKPFAKGFDRIFTHEETSDSRTTKSPPILDWWIKKSWDELAALNPPEKPEKVSVIASSKSFIEGHKRRVDFVNALEQYLPEIPVFGAGRSRTLRDKWDGLAAYQYSIAIENTSKADYWTEKIADCFLSYTVPIYFGATNINRYFPSGSFIWLPLNDPDLAVKRLRHALLHDSYSSRIQAVTEARRLVLEKYSLYGRLTNLVRKESELMQSVPLVPRKVHGRRTRPRGWVRGLGVRENLRLQATRVSQKHSSRG